MEVHVTEADVRAALERDVRAGLGDDPKWLSPVWFYDDRGSELFDRITRLPEYYLTRAERRLLEAHALEVAEASEARTLVELGAGTCEKSRVLLDAFAKTGTLERYVPLDVSEGTLWAAATALASEYPSLEVHAVVGNFHDHLDRVPAGGRRLFAFLGSTIGNLDPAERRRFLGDVRAAMAEGDTLLLGTDLVKDEDRLVAAYDDAQGVTAEFNRNVLHVLNRELDATFDPRRFAHVAVWEEGAGHMEMRLRSTTDQVVEIGDLAMEATFGSGEELRTEISAKFTKEQVAAELAEAGFTGLRSWEDAEGFLLTLSSPNT